MQSNIEIKKGFIDTWSLWQMTIGHTWNMDIDRYNNILHNKTLIGAFIGDQLIGVVVYDFDVTRNSASINLIMVHPEFQRRGIGTRLLDEAKHQLLQSGISKVVLCYNEQGGFWRALPNNLLGADLFFSANGWNLDTNSLDQTGNIEGYKSPDFLNIRPRRQDLLFRFFEFSDREKLLDFQSKNFPHWRVYFEEFIAEKRYKNIIVVYINDELIGSCLLEYPGQKFMGSNWTNMLGAECGSPSVLGVAEDYRGYGVGYYLFDHAMATLAEHGAKHAFINASDAPGVYKRFGFDVIWQYKQGICAL